MPLKPALKIAVLTAALALPAWQVPARAEARACYACGQFYPADRQELRDLMNRFLAPEKGEPAVHAEAALVPHAGYTFSGEAAGKVYRRLADSYKTVIILGTAHASAGQGALLTSEDFETPLGTVAADTETIAGLLKNRLFKNLPRAHEKEHSIEVQLPFLQTILKDFRIIPVALGDLDTDAAVKTGRALAEAVDTETTLCVISADLSHYPDKNTAELSDLTILKALEFMDPHYFALTDRIIMAKELKGLSCTTCGKAALEAGLAYAAAAGANRAQQVAYANSAQSQYGSASSVVGYGGMLFLKTPNAPAAAISLTKQQKRHLLKLAREALHSGITGARFQIPHTSDPVLNLPAAVFVTLTKKGTLRGCLGTVELHGALNDAVAYYARAAATSDYRFAPLAPKEENDVTIEISILSKPAVAAGWRAIKPAVHGVIVVSGGKSGVFLPQVWEKLKTREEFLSELCTQKAGLAANCYTAKDTTLLTFTASHFSENDSFNSEGRFLHPD
ncbi:MAG: AmmeMemoRadiSam system protein B [Elusimicrobiaceae bacterium]|nr:AmmeMemoRadiSam system protein B [Elusimicrobiaceae bacterium]